MRHMPSSKLVPDNTFIPVVLFKDCYEKIVVLTSKVGAWKLVHVSAIFVV